MRTRLLSAGLVVLAIVGVFAIARANLFGAKATVALVSARRGGQPIDGQGRDSGAGSASISADGKWLAFSSGPAEAVSGALDLCPSARTGRVCSNIFIRDLGAGTTRPMSWPSKGGGSIGQASMPVLSADGRFVAYVSPGTDIPDGTVTHDDQVYRRDLLSGSTTLVSVGLDAKPGNGTSGNPAISADGRVVAFASDSTNLVPKLPFEAGGVYVRDIEAGTTSLASVGTSGQNRGQPALSAGGPSISGDGRYVAFITNTSLVPGDKGLVTDAYVHDRESRQTSLVSGSRSGAEANGPTFHASLSHDGRYVAFCSSASNAVGAEYAGAFVRDLVRGTTEAVAPSSRVEAPGCEAIAISGSGRFVAFTSRALGLVRETPKETCDAPVCPNVFVSDRSTGRTVVVTGGDSARAYVGGSVSISSDGRRVAYTAIGARPPDSGPGPAPEVFLVSVPSALPAWAAALVSILVVTTASIVFGLIRRANRRLLGPATR